MKAFDVILLPGLRLDESGQPQREMYLRVCKAYELWTRGLAPKIAACGGDAAGAGISEAETMRRMLIDLGIPGEAVIVEDSSYITAENFRNAARIPDLGTRAALCTGDYHMLRAKLLCRKAGFKVKGFKARTPFGIYKLKLCLLEGLGILDALCGWQDEGRKRPESVERFKRFLTRTLRDGRSGKNNGQIL